LPTITVTSDYDGDVWYDNITGYDKRVGGAAGGMNVGYRNVGKGEWQWIRIFCRFPLTDLPVGATVTEVRRRIYCLIAGGASHLIDDHAYGSNGQEDPANDNAQTCFNRCVSGNLYQNDSTELRTTGEKWATLGGSVCQDVMNARSVGYFAMAIHEEGENDPYAVVSSYTGPYPLKLEITYTVPPLAPYSYSDGLVTVQV